MRSERYREQFVFLRENGISTQEDMAAFQARTEDELASLTKQRTILNVKKKKRQKLHTALTDVAALSQAKALYEEGLSGMEEEFSRYMEAVSALEQCDIPAERLAAERLNCTSSWLRSTATSGPRESGWSCAGKSKVSSLRWSGR